MTTVTISTQSDADFNRNFTYKTSGGAPIDITGKTFRMSLRKTAADEEVDLALVMNDGITISDAPNGVFNITIPQAKLAKLPPNTYVHSLIMTESGGAQTLIWNGTLIHSAGPSR